MTATPGAGNVQIELGGTTYEMVPTLGALQAICRNYGGLIPAMRKCSEHHLDTIIDVIALGIGQRSRDLPDLVFQAGLTPCSRLAVRYLDNLSHGGRPPGDVDADPLVERSPSSETG